MNETLTWDEFQVLAKLVKIVELAKVHGIAAGEGKADTDKVEWNANEVKITIT